MDQPPDADLDAPMSNPEEEEDRLAHESELDESEEDSEDPMSNHNNNNNGPAEDNTIIARIQRRKEFEAVQRDLQMRAESEALGGYLPSPAGSNHKSGTPSPNHQQYLYAYPYMVQAAMQQHLQQQQQTSQLQQPMSATSSLTGSASPPNNGMDSPRGQQNDQDQSKYTYEEQFKQPLNSGTRISSDDKGSFQQVNNVVCDEEAENIVVEPSMEEYLACAESFDPMSESEGSCSVGSLRGEPYSPDRLQLEDDSGIESNFGSQPKNESMLTPNELTFKKTKKKLYELSDDPRRKEFLDDLFSYMQKRGTPVNRIPIMAKQVLDLFELYRLVVARGGLVEVINKKIWREITKGLNLPSSITSAAFTLRTQYMKYLYPYECVKEKLSTNEELQAAIDGNKREGRRSSYGPYTDIVPAPRNSHPGGAIGLMAARPPLVNGHGPPAGRASVSPLPLAYYTQHNSHLPLNLKQENGLYGNHALSSANENNALSNHLQNNINLLGNWIHAANNSHSRLLGEEDNCNSIPSTPNPMVMPQQEALNLEVSRSSSAHNNNNNSSSGGDHKPLNMARKHFEDNNGPSPAKRPMMEDRHLNITTTNIKISSRNSDGRPQENGIAVTMEVNGVLYQGMLFATPHRNRL